MAADLSQRTALWSLATLCVLFIVAGLAQAARDAPTVDEAVDLTAGLVAVEHRDLRMNPEHGLLHHVVPGVLPAVLADPLVPRTDAYEAGRWFDYTDDLVRANDEAGRLDTVLLWFRVMPVLSGAATAAVLYAVAARLVNRLGGLVVAGLWLTTPYVVGLSHLSSLDISFSLALASLVLALDRHRERPTTLRLVAVAAVLGFALLVRHNAMVLVPVAGALAFVWNRAASSSRHGLRAVVALFVIPVAVVWVAHRAVDPSPVAGLPGERFDAIVDSAAAEGPLERLALAAPLPTEWRAGLGYLMLTSGDRPAYLLGSTWDGGRPGFFLASAAIKLPATVWLAIVAGLLGWTRLPGSRRRRALVVAGIPAAVVAAFLVAQPLNLGLRLAIPVIALLLLASAGVAALGARSRWAVIALVTLGQLGSFAEAHPDALAWTPPPFDHGYRHVSDSSVDFGQAGRLVRRSHEREAFAAASVLSPRGYDVLPGVPRVDDVPIDDLRGRMR